MMPSPRVVFLINLLQDVNIVRPLVFMAARDLGLAAEFLVTREFVKYDKTGLWQRELDEIAQSTAAPILFFDAQADAIQLLQGSSGVLIAASESNLSAHAPAHDVFRLAPASYLKITLQHGFECVGFLHNKAHDQAYGRQVTFAADVVSGWCDGARLTSMAPSQRPKLYVSGPPFVLQTRRSQMEQRRADRGLVCENLHSVRLNVAGDFKSEFMDVFGSFCTALAAEGRQVTLRPHPGGQYVLKNKVELPPNVTLNNNPMYKVDLAQFAYGISAPSSVLLDMLLAGIPTALWRDGSGVMDGGNYDALAEISSLKDWIDFSREAVARPEPFVKRQTQFLERQKMPTDPAEVHRRFAALLHAGMRSATRVEVARRERERVLFVANGYLPTLQICFIKPLAPLVETGEIATDILTEEEMKMVFGERLQDETVHSWLDKRMVLFKPSIIVFCRYSGPHAEHLVARARRAGIPVVFHIDDDLLNVPMCLGQRKFEYHNDPKRLRAVHYLLDKADLVYCSTEPLKARLEQLGSKAPKVAGRINCSGSVLVPAIERPVRKIGYMASADHAHNLEMVLPAIVEILRRHQNVVFELFGSIPNPAVLEEFGDRVRALSPISDYEDFLERFASLGWDIGICPLAPTDFNNYKGNNKWIEYTSVGAAVVASRGMVYDECCSTGCGMLADTHDEWLAALEKLIHNPCERVAQVRRAQRKLAEEYSTELLRDQVLGVLAWAKAGAWQDNASSTTPSVPKLAGPRTGEYERWIAEHDRLSVDDRRAIEAEIRLIERPPLVSILLIDRDSAASSEADSARSITSVLGQLYSHWELLIPPQRIAVLMSKDARLRPVQTKSLHDALSGARGQVVAFLEAGDLLPPHALATMVLEQHALPASDVLYSDEDMIGADGRRRTPYFKCEWNSDLFLAQDYACRLAFIETGLARQLARGSLTFAGVYDLVLRIVEHHPDAVVRHVPFILYHKYGERRQTETEEEAMRGAAEDHVGALAHRTGLPAPKIVQKLESHRRVIWPLPTQLPSVSLIVPTRDRMDLLSTCIEGLTRNTDYPNLNIVIVDNDSRDPVTQAYLSQLAGDGRIRVISFPGPFNYSVINNLGVAQSAGAIVGLLNNDLRIFQPGWLREMVSHAVRPDVGAVGAMLYYPDDKVQHSGIVLGIGSVASHILKGHRGDSTGYHCRMALTQELSAVTGACLLTRREVWEKVGGLDESLGVAYNDVDFCLRVREAGYRVIWTPFARLYHLESASRGPENESGKRARFESEKEKMRRRWGNKLSNDPFYSPNLSLTSVDCRPAFPPRVQPQWKARASSELIEFERASRSGR